ncbi:cbb3-type cytochrome oxidase subunit 3 [Chromatocurvus halotolerans]|uniref:Cytochrome c oxidase cbb3-type subunit 4 n=1 Tax=Chromatocurvus halotolerans TaxID=1132028 RepID=A0A4R2KV33_9GAMM|nr:cbb3-type cytochrome c oxidase subunit 3 [Chromatocurvus halotolerans]TCO77683.1 cytochrome c oxidase cbb3-type subunit 4 [Chromatocurvus halotolerans]
MDINDLRGLSTLFLFMAFIGLCIWAYSSKRKKTFDEAANLPFADEESAPDEPQREQEEKQQ